MEQQIVKKIKVICPICKEQKEINLPLDIFNQNKNLTTVSIQKGLVCSHHFQIFIDKDFKVRGYQKVDFEIPQKEYCSWNSPESSDKKRSSWINNGKLKNKQSISSNRFTLNSNSNMDLNKSNSKHMNLKKIYEEFWEYIDDENILFYEFIKTDPRRKSKF
ncbi:MAG: hypothetical protein EU550_02200 [Promethearchaeota archaeon]|nr:MAG: hypothetical protein EU550_02200 [Candidatus Lokiarchaeota archaeon]